VGGLIFRGEGRGAREGAKTRRGGEEMRGREWEVGGLIFRGEGRGAREGAKTRRGGEERGREREVGGWPTGRGVGGGLGLKRSEVSRDSHGLSVRRPEVRVFAA
ncbi:MAG: hypothetical protein RIS92_2401, partial [Verrucomicrobiota bacterium]